MVEATIGTSVGHTPDADVSHIGTVSVRRASLVAGAALVVMTPLAAFANFFVLDALVTPGDAAQTATAILSSESAFRVAVASLFVVAVLDLLVAWALYTVFEPVNRAVALLMAWFRVAYTAVFVVAIGRLVGALSTLTAADAATVFSTEQHYALALLDIDAFYAVWDAALILVGLHLLVLGYLVYRSGSVPSYRSGYVPTVLGVLVAIAGVGYVADSFGRVLVSGYAFDVAAFTFVGEVLLILWLFVYGRRVGPDGATAPVAD